jgi:membrane dipeptidase
MTRVKYEDVSESTVGGDFDYPRARAGGLNAPFMSIYIPASYQETGGARVYADSLIDYVENLAASNPDKFAVAKSVADVRDQFSKGLISLPMGIENGAAFENDLSLVEHFANRGVRYTTLTHGKDNLICDSSYDDAYTWNGLSEFGENVVREMNRLGIMVDISHVTDSTFYDVLKISEVPVIASHSSVRSFTPGWHRNMSDDLIKALAENGGVIMITFGSSFLSNDYRQLSDETNTRIKDHLKANGLDRHEGDGFVYYEEERRNNPIGTVADVVKHINHVVELVGIDHVGIGSDFDGVFGIPDGLKDVSDYPVLVSRLLASGYSNDDVKKILGENLLRVWEETERYAASR